MENKTVLILKSIVGEYDYSYENIDGVYCIDKPDFDLISEFNKYLKEFYESHGFEVLIMGEDDNHYIALKHVLHEYRKEYKGRIRELNKKLNALLKDKKNLHDIKYYVEEVLKLEKLNFIELYID